MDPQSRSNPPDPDLGAPIGPIFSKNTKKTGDFEYKPGIFFDSAISQEVGVGSTVEIGPQCLTPPDLNPEKSGGIRGYAAYPGILYV